MKTRNKRAKKMRMLAVDDRCVYCLKPLTLATATFDHVVPRSKGGVLSADNVVLACGWCNLKKGDKQKYRKLTPRYFSQSQ